MKSAVAQSQRARRPPYRSANRGELVLELIQAHHTINGNASVERDPIHLRAPAMNVRTDVGSPALRRAAVRIGEHGRDPRAEASLFPALVEKK